MPVVRSLVEILSRITTEPGVLETLPPKAHPKPVSNAIFCPMSQPESDVHICPQHEQLSRLRLLLILYCFVSDHFPGQGRDTSFTVSFLHLKTLTNEQHALIPNFFFHGICVCIYVHLWAHTTAQMWRSESKQD